MVYAGSILGISSNFRADLRVHDGVLLQKCVSSFYTTQPILFLDMWQSSGVKNKLLAVVRKREKERLKPHFHVKRVEANVELMTHNHTSVSTQRVRLILNDLTNQGGGFFSQQAFSQGEELMITIHEPMSLKIHARVVWCQTSSTGRHVISKESFNHRVGVKFILTQSDESTKLDEFIKLITEAGLGLSTK